MDIDGRVVELFSHVSFPAVLVFILKDCPICNAYVPELNRLHDEYAKRGVTFVVVHEDLGTTADEAREHAREYDLKCKIVVDAQQAWSRRLGARNAPEVAVISCQCGVMYRGRIDDQYAGLGKRRTVVTSHDLRDALEAILAGKPVLKPRTEAVGCPIPSAN